VRPEVHLGLQPNTTKGLLVTPAIALCSSVLMLLTGHTSQVQLQ
jgi:hypothetical protein